MMELWHDVGGGCWKGIEEEVTRRGGAVGRAICCPGKYLDLTWVDVCALGIRSEVVSAGAGVGYFGTLWGKEEV